MYTFCSTYGDKKRSLNFIVYTSVMQGHGSFLYDLNQVERGRSQVVSRKPSNENAVGKTKCSNIYFSVLFGIPRSIKSKENSRLVYL